MENQIHVATPSSFRDKLLYIDIPFDPPGDVRSPFAEYAAQRAINPVVVNPSGLGPGQVLVFVYGHAQVVQVLQNNAVFSSLIFKQMMGPMMGERLLLGMDEPEHGRYRNLVAPALRPKLIARWEHDLVHKVVDDLIDSFASRGHAELVQEFNFSFPTLVMSRILGLPSEDFEKFKGWAIDIVGGAGDPEPGIRAGQEIRAYLAPVLASKRSHPQDDMISELVKTEIDGERLDEDEIFSFLQLLLPAGIETTFRALGSLVFNLLTHPEQFGQVRNDRKLVAAAIEETLRTDAPIQYPPRVVLQDTEIAGVKIPAGAVVVSVLGAANRDPAFVDDPERFNINRPVIRHVTFGNGVHTCIGLHLAKMELGIAINRLIDRLPNLRFDEERAKTMDAHIRGKSFRSPTAVPVRWDA